jgi:hypothetical protein
MTHQMLNGLVTSRVEKKLLDDINIYPILS